MDISFFTHRFSKENLPLEVSETNYKVKKVKKLLLGKIWPPTELVFQDESELFTRKKSQKFQDYQYCYSNQCQSYMSDIDDVTSKVNLFCYYNLTKLLNNKHLT